MIIKEQIQKILDLRESFLAEVETDANNLNEYRDRLAHLLEFAPDFESMTTDNATKIRLGSVSTKATEIISEINKALDENGAVARMRTRAGRSYLNIGIAAPWRHGKSTFLTTIFNLPEEVSTYLIPTSPAPNEACTGTTVHYINDDVCRAEITYFKEADIVSSIKAIVKKLGYSDMLLCCSDTVTTLSSLVSKIKETESYKTKIEGSNAKHTDEQTLQEYLIGSSQSHYGQFFTTPTSAIGTIPFNIDHNSPTDTHSLNEIFKRICFYSSPQNMDSHNSYMCLGVKEVRIYMPLKGNNGADLGKIQFVDTPGLGEKRTEVEANLTKVLKSDIDIVIGICFTDKPNADQFNAFNEYLCKDFNVKYTDEGGNTKDATNCIFYIINCNKDDSQLGYKIYKAETECILNSLNQPKFKNPIKLPRHQIGYLSLRDETVYAINEDTKATKNASGAFVYDVSNPSTFHGATIEFLVKCLASIEDITQIDKYFSHEAIEIINCIKKDYSTLVAGFDKLKLEHLNLGAKNDELKSKIAAEVRNIAPTYFDDDSLDKMKHELSLGAPCFVSNFIKSEILNEPVDWSAIERSKVVEAHKLTNELLTNPQYNTRQEFLHYYRLKDSFKSYITQKVLEYLNEEAIQKAQMTCGHDIIQVFNKYLGVVFSDGKSLTPEEFVRAFETFVVSKGYGQDMLECFEELLNPTGYKKSLEDYLVKTLSPYYHREKNHGADGGLSFVTPEMARQTFVHWLIDIMEAISKVLEGTVNGTQSFAELIEDIKRSYEEDTLLDVWKLDEPSKLKSDLSNFIYANGPVLHDSISIDRKIDAWNEIVSPSQNEK